MHRQEDERGQKWRDALIAVLPPSAQGDESIVDFLVEEIITSSIRAEHTDGFNYDDGTDEATEEALHSILAEHLATLLDMGDAEVIFLVRDLLDTYRSPRPLAADGAGAGAGGATGRGAPPIPDSCELCARPVSLTIHHLFPRSEHDHFLRHPPSSLTTITPSASASISAPLTAHDMLVKYRAYLCRPCHSAIHRIIPDNREMGSEYHSVERLMGNEDVQRWVGYARGMKQGLGNYQRMGLRYKR